MYAEPAQSIAKREPNIQRLTANDFSGQNLGDVGGFSRDIDSISSRYRRFRGY